MLVEQDVPVLTLVERISLSAPPALVKEFDESTKRLGFGDRSKALQVAMRNFITEYAWKKGGTKHGAGAILLTYDHRSHRVQEELTDTQHAYRSVVGSTTHIHLDEFRCLEIISVRGEIGLIRDLARDLMKKRGVRQLKLSTVTL